MATSPFPGMDPYLERDWLDVHTRLINYICDQIQIQLPGELLARMESRVLVEDADSHELRERHPGVRVVETPGGQGGMAILERPEIATAEPDLFLVAAHTEPVTQRYVEIVDSQTRGRVVTTIELISPSNKAPGIGQKLYLAKREECVAAKVNFVEIDLTRGGDRLWILPDLAVIKPPPTYVGCVRRATQAGKIAVYLFRLDRPLKPMRIPLRPTDNDVILDLQPAIMQAYERGRYDRLDYNQPLTPPLSADDAAIAERFIGAASNR